MFINASEFITGDKQNFTVKKKWNSKSIITIQIFFLSVSIKILFIKINIFKIFFKFI